MIFLALLISSKGNFLGQYQEVLLVIRFCVVTIWVHVGIANQHEKVRQYLILKSPDPIQNTFSFMSFYCWLSKKICHRGWIFFVWIELNKVKRNAFYNFKLFISICSNSLKNMGKIFSNFLSIDGIKMLQELFKIQFYINEPWQYCFLKIK